MYDCPTTANRGAHRGKAGGGIPATFLVMVCIARQMECDLAALEYGSDFCLFSRRDRQGLSF